MEFHLPITIDLNKRRERELGLTSMTLTIKIVIVEQGLFKLGKSGIFMWSFIKIFLLVERLALC